MNLASGTGPDRYTLESNGGSASICTFLAIVRPRLATTRFTNGARSGSKSTTTYGRASSLRSSRASRTWARANSAATTSTKSCPVVATATTRSAVHHSSQPAAATPLLAAEPPTTRGSVAEGNDYL